VVDHRKCEVQPMPKRRIAKIWIHSLGLSKDAGASQALSANLYQSKRNTSRPSHLGHQFPDLSVWFPSADIARLIKLARGRFPVCSESNFLSKEPQKAPRQSQHFQ
jgi:hypothetical protein